jgi:hypothetical protein
MSTTGRAALPEGVGPTVSAALPRLALVAGAVLGVVAQTAGRDLPPAAWLPVVLALVAAWRPALPAAWLAVTGLGVLAVLGGGGVDARDALTVLAVHVVHLGAALASVLPAGSRVEVLALLPTWRRFLLVQALSQAVVGLAAALGPAAGNLAG